VVVEVVLDDPVVVGTVEELVEVVVVEDVSVDVDDETVVDVVMEVVEDVLVDDEKLELLLVAVVLVFVVVVALLDVVVEEVPVEVVVVEDASVDVDDDTVVDVVTEVVEDLVVDEEELELLLVAVVLVLVDVARVEDVLVELVLVVVPADAGPRSTLIRPAWIWPATKLPVRFAPSTIRSVDSGAQRWARIRETRPNVTSVPPTKRVRSRAARPDTSSMLALWPIATFPATSTRVEPSISSSASRAARRLPQNV